MTARHESFAEAYTQAVMAWLRSGAFQAVDYQRESDRFVAYVVQAGTSPTDCDLWVNDGWRDFVESLTGPGKLPTADHAMELATQLILRLKSSAKVRDLADRLASD